MDKHPVSDSKTKSTESPAPEVLKEQSEDASPAKGSSEKPSASKPKLSLKPRHLTYRPSHKATFVGLAIVVLILLANVGIIVYLMQTQSKSNSEVSIGGVKISPEVLDTLGVSRNTIGDSGAELVVNPNARFSGSVTVKGGVTIAGQLKLNSKLSASDASFTKLQAGETAIDTLNVNKGGTITNLNLREGLTVVGASKLQGAVTVGQLLTVLNSVNISGNLSVGGVMSMGAFQTNTLTVGGHIMTRGSAPGLSRGGGLGVVDTISNSGNDASGTVAVNIGATARSGVMANVSFVNQYSNTPHVIVTAVGGGVDGLYVNRSANGFSIGVSSISTGGHAFDYIVVQ